MHSELSEPHGLPHAAALTQPAWRARAALVALYAVAVLSAALWLLMFTRPYSLASLHTYMHLDLERIQIMGRRVHWPMLLALFTQGALYWLGYQAARQVRGRAAWVGVILTALLPWAVLLPMYPIGSTDVFDYILHGRMVGLYDANPFVQTARNFPGDLFSRYVGWPTATSAYGPLWEMLAGRVAQAADFVVLRYGANSVIANVIAFKLLAAAFLAGSAAIIGFVLHRRAPERALAGVFLLASNPVVVYETLGNGHNDIVMVFFVLLAVPALLYRRFTWAVLALLAGALIKFIPILMAPAAVLLALRDLPNHRARARFVLITAAAGLAFIVVCYFPFWNGIEVLSIERRAKLFTSSLPTIIAFLLAPRLGLSAAMSRISLLAAGLMMLFAIWEGLRAWRDRSWMSFTRSAFDISIFYLLGAALWVWPWYSVWPLALAALLPAGGPLLLAQFAAFGLSVRPYLFGYLALARPRGPAAWQELRLSPGVLALPWLALVYLTAASLLRNLRAARAPKRD